ncbi:FtsK/SpoIIIE domain-containing protein [aff. Roholtiella sp. LEGE 12411]|uniref:FtsK/SpoIIIE domain-containing protein n=1 Tax=aff. Roholtiella sp. LEGE 12411 TaxID=1828822 RepID=UPI0018824B94|nr:FtsK/SpoIIIE domain-containing protein [aff. Roholtiella sp. LEGE 12411]MBE9037007.1 DNA translocase FtsK [aff. Roholtiella sp. LEGE 12411]
MLDALSKLGIRATWGGYVDAPSFERIKLIPSENTKFAQFKNIAEDLKIACSYASVPFISSQPGYVAVDIPKKDYDRYFCPLEKYPLNSNSLTIPIGVNIEGHLIEADLCDSNSPHFLVGGTTGGGKSEWLVAVICSLIERFTPAQLQIVLIDPKQVSFPFFDGLPWCGQVIKSQEAAVAKLQNLVKDMERRYTKFAANSVRDLKEYKAKGLTDIPQIVVLFDEFADFVADKNDKECFELVLKKLAAKARGAGIHLILSTQRPDASVVTPLIRSNLPGRIALKTKTLEDGKIIMGAECPSNNLLGKGDLIFDAENEFVRLQSLWVKSPIEFIERIKNNLLINADDSTSLLSTDIASNPVTEQQKCQSTSSALPQEADIENSLLSKCDSNELEVELNPVIEGVSRKKVIKSLLDFPGDLPPNPLLEALEVVFERQTLASDRAYLMRLVLNKNIGKQKSILWLTGVRSSGSDFYSKYPVICEIYEKLVDDLERQGYNKDNNWGLEDK